MYGLTAKDRIYRLMGKFVSILLIVGLCLMNTSLSFAEFSSVKKFGFSASVTIGGVGPDTDYDGIPDDWERANGLDIDAGNHDDLFDDNDLDGFNNIEEYRLRTNPQVKNSSIQVILNASPSIGIIDQDGADVMFTAQVVNDGGFAIVKYELDFDGNGTYDWWCYGSEYDLNNPLDSLIEYQYTGRGRHEPYNVKLRVTNAMGQIGIAQASVNIITNGDVSLPAAIPESNYIGGASGLSIPSTIQLNTQAQDNGHIVRYQWDTDGNGEYDISSNKSPNIVKTYNETLSRSYYAAIKVTDTNGLSDIAPVGIRTNAASWNDSPHKPKVYPGTYIINNAIAGIPVSLSGVGGPQGNFDQRFPPNPNTYGYSKRLEWDFNGDGIYDRVFSANNNPDWNGRGDTTYTYGAPGIYRAVLRVNTEANVSAKDSVLVIVRAANSTPPVASATVKYNGGIDDANSPGLTKIDDGKVPVKTEFDHSASQDLSVNTITKYEWDFDGDKTIDYVTTDRYAKPHHDYKFPGYFLATLTVTDVNGLIDSFYIPVFASYAEGHSSHIMIPSEDRRVYGNAVTLICEVYPDDVDINRVKFQYRGSNPQTDWFDITDTPVTAVSSYMTGWNTIGLSGEYQLRAIVDNQDSALFKITDVFVDPFDPEDREIVSGNMHIKETKVNPDEANTIILPDGTRIEIPEGAIEGDAQVSVRQILDAGIGQVMLDITGIDNFLKDITIYMYYDDADNNGIVDGTNIDETTLAVAWVNDQGEWEQAFDSVVHPDENFVSARTNHLSGWGLIALGGGGAGAAAAGSSSSSIGGGSSISFCFIATAAYGTPFADEVVVLKEFRDKCLLQNEFGVKFVNYYYSRSPVLASYIRNKPKVKALVRWLLGPLVKMAKAMVR